LVFRITLLPVSLNGQGTTYTCTKFLACS
jgi:hypothetical protein